MSASTSAVVVVSGIDIIAGASLISSVSIDGSHLTRFKEQDLGLNSDNGNCTLDQCTGTLHGS